MKNWLRSPNLPLAATLLVLLVLFSAGSILYEGFFSLRVIVNLFGDNAFLGIAAIGMTFVILSGGIDLSVGSVMALTTILVATMIEKGKVHPCLAVPAALAFGIFFGATMGFLIHRFELPPFLVTLAGMFLARGLAFMINKESIGITHPVHQGVQDFGLRLSDRATIPSTAIIFLALFALAVLVAHRTRFGQNVYAVGGSESSARLMGLPVGLTKIMVYTVCGFCSALAGIVATFYMGSGNPSFGIGFELDVIASVVIGGTLLSGGVGTLAGTLTGVLIFGTIQTALNFDGRLNSWWLRIAVGLLLLLFILFQKFLSKASTLQSRVNVTTEL